MTIIHVEVIHEKLNNIMQLNSPVIIDPTEVKKIDTACLQLLCVIQKSLHELGQQITWQGRSEVLLSSAKLIGVNEFLNL